MTKKKKILLTSLLSLVVLIVLGLGLIGNFFYDLALNPNSSKEMVFGTTEEQETTSGVIVDEDVNWLLNEVNSTEAYILSDDQLNLHSYKIMNETPSNKWVISVHGYTGDGIKMSSYAKRFYEMGYNVLIPDLRGHGLSDGDYIGMGWDDRLDILSWIDYLLTENPDAEIILHGISMGSATVTMTSGEDLPSNVKAIIADCGYTSVWDQFAYQLNDLFSLPEFPIMHVSSFIAQLKAGYSLKEASSIEQVKQSKTPILYIHGDQDDFVPYAMMKELYDATASDKQMLTVEGAPHARSASTNPQLYWTTIYNFVNQYVSE